MLKPDSTLRSRLLSRKLFFPRVKIRTIKVSFSPAAESTSVKAG